MAEMLCLHFRRFVHAQFHLEEDPNKEGAYKATRLKRRHGASKLAQEAKTHAEGQQDLKPEARDTQLHHPHAQHALDGRAVGVLRAELRHAERQCPPRPFGGFSAFGEVSGQSPRGLLPQLRGQLRSHGG